MSNVERFKYSTMSNKVLKQDRTGQTRGEPTGESDRVTTSDLKSQMGSAVVARPSKAPLVAKRKKEQETIQSAAKRVASDAYEELIKSGGTYAPTTKLTERAWEAYLTQVMGALPDVPRDVLRSAAEETLNVLKNAERTARDKRSDVEDLLGEMSDEAYRGLVEKAEQITDFVVQTAAAPGKRSSRAGGESEIAIVFEDDEAEEGEEGLAALDADEEAAVEAEVVSSESEEEEEQDMDEEKPTRVRRVRANGDDENVEEEDDRNLVEPHLVDAYWLQREIALTTSDSSEAQRLAELVLEVLADKDGSVRENLLVSNLGFERFELVKKLLKNRSVVYYCTRLARARDEKERDEIKSEMLQDPTSNGELILSELGGNLLAKAPNNQTKKKAQKQEDEVMSTDIQKVKKTFTPSGRLIDLNSLARLNPRQRTGQVVLPKGSRRVTKHYEEVHVRPHKPRPMGEDEKLIQIASLPDWMKPAFKQMMELNRIQSKVFPAIMNEERFNMLVSAPTGAGKTNVAMLSIMNEVGQFVVNGKVDTVAMKERMKIVYVAPMKALVQEVVANFSSRLTDTFGIVVKELSGDQQLSRAELASTQIIVTTPEKWDVVTRKAGERSYVSLVRLIIIDEIHLLHDSRGAVLEAVVARTLRTNEENKSPCRILGISATLPNFQDVAVFLRVPLDRGLFFFDNSFRPVPLQQQFVGVTDQKAITRMKTMDQICFEKVTMAAKDQQVLVFVHSRKDTVRTAKMLRDKAQQENLLQNFLPAGVHSREVLMECATREPTPDDDSIARSNDLRDLLPYGFAVHHAGMFRSDRKLVEDLFADKHVRVLISTATLAWGVNLPARTVVIKGTQIYDPEQGKWTELSHLDILQMLGRAGRPQHDTEGEGIVITTHAEMQHYLSLLNDQLPVESNLMKKLPEHLNAEIVCGNVASIEDAVRWLEYSFLLVRAIKHPERYGVTKSLSAQDDDEEDEDVELVQWRVDLAHAAMLMLEKCGLVRYDRKSGLCQGTSLGRIASHYYLSPDTCAAFIKMLEPTATEIDLLRVITTADEFKQIQVRHEEKAELAKLSERVPIPIKESLEDPSAKVNVLLQSYISRAGLEGYCLACDLVFIHQSAGRLARALFEIALMKNWATTARKCLTLCLCIDQRLWRSQNPLRQFTSIPEDILKKLENKSIPFSRYYDLSAIELGSSVGQPQMGQVLYRAIHRFPKVDIAARVQTMTRTVIKVELALTADFDFNEQTHGPGLLFWILVEDVDGMELLHHQPFVLKSKFAGEEHLVTFTVQLTEPTPPFFFVRVESDSYLHSSASLAVPLSVLTLPPKTSPFTELLDLSPIQVKSLPLKSQRVLFEKRRITQFWPNQTQAMSFIENDDSSVLIACPIGKTLLGELAMTKSFEKDPDARVIYLAPNEELCDVKYRFWHDVLQETEGKKVVRLQGLDLNADLEALTESHLAIATSKTWEVLTRRWKQKSKRVVTEISLLIVDDLHILDENMEICLSRTRYMAAQLDRHIRIVALSSSITNAEDVAGWMDAKKILSLSPASRPKPTEIVVKGFTEYHFETRMGIMSRPCYRTVRGELGDEGERTTMVFLPSKRHLRMLLVDFINYASAENRPISSQFSEMNPKDLEQMVSDSTLRSALISGIAIVHESMSQADVDFAERAFCENKVRLMFSTAKAVWRMRDDTRADHAMLLGTSWFKNKRYEEYPFPMVLKMLNRALSSSSNTSTQQTLFCHDPVKDLYKRFLVQGMNLESSLDQSAPDILLAEIVSKTIETKQDAVDFFTWTLFYRRLLRNPSYYGMLRRPGVSPEDALSSFLSDTVERVLGELREAKCLEEEQEEDDQKVQASPLGIIASFHDVRSSTVDLFASSLQPKTKTAGLLEIVSSASEYLDTAAVRAREEVVLERMARNTACVVHKLPDALNYSESYVKSNILLQAWCSRFPLASGDQREDLVAILKDAPRLLHALVDVASTHGWLRVTLSIVELCQSIIQQVWTRDSPLRQIPFFDSLLADRAAKWNLHTVYDLIEMDDDKRDEFLSVLDQTQLAKVAEFCNAYPSLAIKFQSLIGDKLKPSPDPKNVHGIPLNSTFAVHLSLEKDFDDSQVISDRFPHPKSNIWWAMLGDPQTNVLYAIKRIVNDQAKLACEFSEPGVKNLKLYVVCDSYVGCDQVFDISVDVVEQ